MAYLYIESQDEDISNIVIGTKLTIGRAKDNNLVLSDIFISRKQAVIFKENNRYWIRDLNSTYGTFVNNKKIQKRVLMHGDTILIGKTRLIFLEDLKLSILPEEFSKTEEEVEKFRKTLYNAGIAESVIKQLVEKMQTVLRHKEILSTLYKVSEIISSAYDIEHLLNITLETAVKSLLAKRGFIVFIENGKFVVKASRGIQTQDIKEMEISTGIIKDVVRRKKGKLITNAVMDPNYNMFESVVMHNLHSLLVVPIKDRYEQVFGVIYVDDKEALKRKTFSVEELNFLEEFARQVSIAIENIELKEKIFKEETLRAQLSRYLPPQLIEEAIKKDILSNKQGIKREATILFVDIRNFTKMTETIDEKKLLSLLNYFFDKMTEVVFKYEGMIDKFIGDGMMVIFGAPYQHGDDPIRAIKSGKEMIKNISMIRSWMQNNKGYEKILSNFNIGVGIATGKVILGSIGSSRRMDYTAIGETVNLSSRLCGLAEPGEMLISPETYKKLLHLSYFIKTQTKQDIYVKGISNPLTVHIWQSSY